MSAGTFFLGVYLGGMLPILIGYYQARSEGEEMEPVEYLALTLLIWPVAPFIRIGE